MTWSPKRYCKFEDARNRRPYDFLVQIPAGGAALAADPASPPSCSHAASGAHGSLESTARSR